MVHLLKFQVGNLLSGYKIVTVLLFICLPVEETFTLLAYIYVIITYYCANIYILRKQKYVHLCTHIIELRHEHRCTHTYAHNMHIHVHIHAHTDTHTHAHTHMPTYNRSSTTS